MRKCWNWQTGQTKDLVVIAIVWVQVPSSAERKPLCIQGFFPAQKNQTRQNPDKNFYCSSFYFLNYFSFKKIRGNSFLDPSDFLFFFFSEFSLQFLFLQVRSYNLRCIASLFQCFDDTVLVIGAECLHCDAELYCSTSVRCEELVVVQFDDVSVLVCNHLGNAYQLAWFIRQKNG